MTIYPLVRTKSMLHTTLTHSQGATMEAPLLCELLSYEGSGSPFGEQCTWHTASINMGATHRWCTHWWQFLGMCTTDACGESNIP